MKQLVYDALVQDLDGAMDQAEAEMRTALASDDFREGIAAWQEKRPPRFTGT